MKVSVSKVENGAVPSSLKIGAKLRQPSFSGASSGAAKTAKKSLKVLASEAVEESYPSWLKKLIHLGNNNGEILNTVVTGIGTAFVAPIFIIWNPLAKEDKETRLYSAWRQPISAVLAVATQIAINKKFNNWMDNQASTGMFGERMNLTYSPRESYLRHQIKHQHPDWTKKQVQDEIKKQQREAEWNEITRRRRLLKSDPEYKSFIEKLSFEELVDKDTYKKAESAVKKEIEDTIFDMKKTGKSSAEIKKYTKIHGKQYINDEAMKRAAQMVEFEVRVDAQTKWIVRKYQLAQQYKDNLSELAIDPQSRSQIQEIINRFNIYKESNQTGTMADFALKDIAEQQELEKFCKGITQTQSLHVSEKVEKVVEATKKQMDELQMIINSATGDTKTIAEAQLSKLRNQGDFGALKQLGNSFEEIFLKAKVKRHIRTGIDKAIVVLKESKNKYGIIVSLLTLPFSCGLLNWVYPRLMEKIMPNTASKKKEAQKKMEARA